MSTFFIQNFGCRATQADADAIRQSLRAQGCSAAESDSSADIVVLNTCTVTAAADAEARESIRRIHRQNPSARIIATGCYAQRAPEELAALPGVSWVVGNSHQHSIASLANNHANFVPLSAVSANTTAPSRILREEVSAHVPPIALPHRSDDSPDGLHADKFDDVFAASRTRPTLKIQDGCNHRCAYCVIPLVRGRSRSLAPATILGEVHRLMQTGAQEIVLSGIDLGSYGRDLALRVSLHALVRKILDETELPSLRLSSIEPIDITQDFVSLVASEPRIAPHFHLPLQSGSDRILRAMHRWYRAAHYARRVELIGSTLPHAAIGADVIAGFPGESDADHAATMNFIAALPLSYLHVFSFSPRPGTEGANLPGAIRPHTIHQRARELRALGQTKAQHFRISQQDTKTRVLTLDRKGENWTGALSGNYLNVRVAGSWPRNRWLEVKIPADPASLAPLAS
ncbi:MAG TPA: tRNA (N(6)-L-threonylcarbamoyladenosine(37)-C(2))-methylthiotransferase MtaB [Candidatus Acidoferrales bacterium]|nr:tRNA (N(6)-L-threonylcarbamoyladenosine(37)-C(2))-methylthiotransferase MtaB [Candidatus Acidoferrales bacterium]